MSFHYEKKSTQLLYQNRFFIGKTSDSSFFLSASPIENPISSIEFINVVEGNEPFSFLDVDGKPLEFSYNFFSEVDLIEFNNDSYLLFVHVTMDEHLDSIRDEGLIPKIGFLSEMIDEKEEKIYLFPNVEDMNNALGNWMGEAYEDYCDEKGLDFDEFLLHSLYVTIPIKNMEHFLEPSTVGFEAVSSVAIPPNFIHYHQEQ